LYTYYKIFYFKKFIGLRTNIHLVKHAALYFLSYLLNICVSCEWCNQSKWHIRNETWGNICISVYCFHVILGVYWTVPYTEALETFVSIDHLMCSLSFQLWRQNLIGEFQYLTLRNLTTGYRIILVGNVCLQIRTFLSPRYLTMFVMIYTSMSFVP
jgi:hypothetical protein